MIVNRTELAELLGKSMPTITSWMGENPPLPYMEGGGKGKPFKFDSVAVIEWYAEHKYRRQRPANPQANPFDDGDQPESYDEAERRKMVANADKAELELAKASGRVVEIDDVAAAVAEMHVKVRTRLLAIGNKTRTRVSAFFSGDKAAEEQVVAVVEEVVADAIAEIRDNPFESDELVEPDE